MKKNDEDPMDWVPIKPIDFDVISENWHVYELEDKSIVRFKSVLTAIHDVGITESETSTNELRKGFFNVKLLSSVFSPKELRKQRGKNCPVSELEKNIIKKNMMFRRVKDGGLARYETAESIILIKTTLVQVDKSSLFDPLRNPQYIVRTESDIIIEEKKPESENENK